METGSATRVYKSSSCVGGKPEVGHFFHLYSTALTEKRGNKKLRRKKNILSKGGHEKLI